MEIEINVSQYSQILKELNEGKTDYLESIIGIKVSNYKNGFINVSASIKNKYKIVW